MCVICMLMPSFSLSLFVCIYDECVVCLLYTTFHPCRDRKMHNTIDYLVIALGMHLSNLDKESLCSTKTMYYYLFIYSLLR